MREKRLSTVRLLLFAAVVTASFIPVSAVVDINQYKKHKELFDKYRQYCRKHRDEQQQVSVLQQSKPKTLQEFAQSKLQSKPKTTWQQSLQSRLETCRQFLREPIYKMPVLQQLHDGACKVVGIKKGLNNFLVQSSKKNWLMRPWISLARKYMTKGFFARKAGVGAVNYLFTPKSWSSWFGLRGIDLIIGGPIVSVSSLIYKWLSNKVLPESINKVLPESIKINETICFIFNLYGKDLFGQMGDKLKDYLVNQAQLS